MSATEWAQPSLCAGWTIRDVAAHLTLAPRTTVLGTVVELARARGSFSQMINDTAKRQADRPLEHLVAELRGIAAAGARSEAAGRGDGLTGARPGHRPTPRPPLLEAARASAEHLWRIGFPFHARKRLRGFRLTATDVDWTAGEGADVRGPVGAILPLLAGRADTLPGLTGYGVPALTGRMVR